MNIGFIILGIVLGGVGTVISFRDERIGGWIITLGIIVAIVGVLFV